MKLLIAGHEWLDQRVDSHCVKIKSDGESCYATRAALFQATQNDVGTVGFAHHAALSQTEYNEINSERELYKIHCEKLMIALYTVCG